MNTPQSILGRYTTILGRYTNKFSDASIVVLRIALAISFIAHGSQKLFGAFGGGGLSGTAEYMTSVGANPGMLSAIAAGVVEFGGGIAVGLGLAARPACLALAMDMVGAVILTNWDNGFFAEKASGGWELNLILFSAALSVALTGAGRISIDSLIAQRILRHPALPTNGFRSGTRNG